jgi:hypothetical protein
MKKYHFIYFVFLSQFFLMSSCNKELPKDQVALTSNEEEVHLAGTSSYPDVTKEFDQITRDTKSRCEQLKNKWPINAQTFAKDLSYLLSINNNIEKYFAIYYGNFLSWQNLDARLDYLKGRFKTNAPGDIKNGVFKKYTQKNGGKVFYKGTVYTVEQLGNVNYGIGCKAIGIPYLGSACAAGFYQVFAQDNLPNSSNGKKLWEAIKSSVKDNKLRGVCLDYAGDTKMIKLGYNWY